jgi:hypothetical protein
MYPLLSNLTVIPSDHSLYRGISARDYFALDIKFQSNVELNFAASWLCS